MATEYDLTLLCCQGPFPTPDEAVAHGLKTWGSLEDLLFFTKAATGETWVNDGADPRGYGPSGNWTEEAIAEFLRLHPHLTKYVPQN